MGGLHDFIYRLDRDTLTAWAYTCERYDREQSGMGFLIGGIVNMIGRWSTVQISDYILEKVDKYPELDSKDKLNALATQYGLIQPAREYLTKEDNRQTLEKWALATEKYHREVNHLHLLGGLDDYISSLTNEKVVEYIVKEVSEHPEIDSADKLNELAVKYGIERITVFSNPIKNNSFDDIIRRKTLEAWALTCEQFHRNANNIHPMGGLHDYISRLSDDEVIEYIKKEVAEHEELNSVEKLDKLAKEYGFDH
jgi:poly-D-alanine transfer protein DltD